MMMMIFFIFEPGYLLAKLKDSFVLRVKQGYSNPAGGQQVVGMYVFSMWAACCKHVTSILIACCQHVANRLSAGCLHDLIA